MKLSLKTSSLLAAVAMSIYCLFAILAQTEFYSNVILAIDSYFVLSYVCSTLLFLSIAVFGLTLFVNRQQLPILSKSLLWQAWIIVGILLFALIFNILGNTIVIHGLPYFAWYRFAWLRYIMLLLVTAWLWQYAYIKPQMYISTKYIGKIGLAVAIIIGLMFLLWLISLAHVFTTGHVFGFNTNVLASWIIPISTILLFAAYLLEYRIKAIFMKRLIPLVLIAFSLFSCQKTEQPKSSVLDLFTNAYYGDMHSFSEWDNRFWEVFPNHGKVEISALTFNVSIAYFDSLRQVIENEFGAYEDCKATVPKELIADTGTYWHLSKACYDAYYWSNDTLAIVWALHDLTDSVGYAYLDIKRLSLNWVLDLEEKNPLKDDWRTISVYFKFDTIINDFEVSGILYPNYSKEYGWSASENGVRLFFYNLKTGKEYIWTDWSEKPKSFKNIFMSKNVSDIVYSKDFNGFKTCDYYTFHYDTTTIENPQNPLLPNAEYQFFDIDFDGEDELLLNYYHGGAKGGSAYEIYEMTDSGLIRKEIIGEEGYFALDGNTIIKPENKTITSFLWCSVSECGIYGYQVHDNGDICSAYHIHNYVNPANDSLISDTTFFIQ